MNILSGLYLVLAAATDDVTFNWVSEIRVIIFRIKRWPWGEPIYENHE